MTFRLFRADRDQRLERVAQLLAEAAPRLEVDPRRFEDRLMREIRDRAVPARPLPWQIRSPARVVDPWAGLRPAALAAAFVLMAVSGSLALLLSAQAGPVRLGPARDAASPFNARVTEQYDDYEDLLTSPREIPFTVETDLVGRRRGTIPLTTYVLEPPPDQTTVLRASL